MSKSTEKAFTRLKPDHELVNRLLNESWWKKIAELSHSDHDINIQLRSDSINVYSKMGNLLRISLKKKQIVCEVHYKYLIAAKSSPYVQIYPETGLLKVGSNECPNVTDILSMGSLKVIKQNISTYAGEEKAIQSKLVEKNKQTIVDVEVAFSGRSLTEEDDKNDARIDLVNFDKKQNKLVFVELKQIFDQRLYCNEINRQIEKYYKFAKNNSAQIIDAYNDCLQTKIKLKIIDESSFLHNVIIEDVEPRPILAIAAYNQKLIDALKKTIVDKLETKHLAGIYFFGTDVDLNINKSINKKLYL